MRNGSSNDSTTASVKAPLNLSFFSSSRAQFRISSAPDSCILKTPSFLQLSLYVCSSSGVVFIHSFFHFLLHSTDFSCRGIIRSSILISNDTVDECGNQRDKQQVSLKKT